MSTIPYNSAYKQFLVKSITVQNNRYAGTRIAIPEDIAREINAFLFYDEETSYIREKKRRLVKSIVASFRKKRMGQCEDWAFIINNRYFAGMNCRFCGNYLMSHQIIRNTRLFCFCDRELVAYEERLRRNK